MRSYLYMEPMEADLHQIVRSGQPLSNSHIQFFIYQLLRGMKVCVPRNSPRSRRHGVLIFTVYTFRQRHPPRPQTWQSTGQL